MSGIHHVTAISGSAERNLEFYERVIGLRFVKKTVNFDDPGTYHLYYGDRVGHPGTILTFFLGSTRRQDVPAWVLRNRQRFASPWARLDTGRIGSSRKVLRMRRWKSGLASQFCPSLILTAQA